VRKKAKERKRPRQAKLSPPENITQANRVKAGKGRKEKTGRPEKEAIPIKRNIVRIRYLNMTVNCFNKKRSMALSNQDNGGRRGRGDKKEKRGINRTAYPSSRVPRLQAPRRKNFYPDKKGKKRRESTAITECG